MVWDPHRGGRGSCVGHEKGHREVGGEKREGNQEEIQREKEVDKKKGRSIEREREVGGVQIETKG